MMMGLWTTMGGVSAPPQLHCEDVRRGAQPRVSGGGGACCGIHCRERDRDLLFGLGSW